MKKHSLLLIFVVAGIVALAGCSSSAPTQPASKGTSRGRVVAIDTEQNMITLNHEEIPNMMMAMEMSFAVADAKLLEGLAVDDAVEFDVELRMPQGMTVTRIKKVDPSELSEKTTSYEGRARVVTVARATGSIMIRAEGIPGISGDGDLVYGVEPPTLLEGIADDDTVEVVLEDRGGGQLVMTGLKKVE